MRELGSTRRAGVLQQHQDALGTQGCSEEHRRHWDKPGGGGGPARSESSSWRLPLRTTGHQHPAWPGGGNRDSQTPGEDQRTPFPMRRSGNARVDAGVPVPSGCCCSMGGWGQRCGGIQGEPTVPTPGIPLCQWAPLAAKEEEGWGCSLRPAVGCWVGRGGCWHAGRAVPAMP